MMDSAVWNFFYSMFFVVIGAAAALPSTIIDAFPSVWKPYIATISFFALAIKSHANLFINPDGSPARCPWEKK